MLDPRLEPVLPRADLSPSDKLVAVGLCKFTDRQGVCWPSVKALMDLTGLSDRQIQRSLQALTAAGFLKASPRFRGKRQTSNLYRFVSGGPGGGAELKDSVSDPEPADTRPPTDCPEKGVSPARSTEGETTTDCHPPKNCRGEGGQFVGVAGDKLSSRELCHKELFQNEGGTTVPRRDVSPVSVPVLMQLFSLRCPGHRIPSNVTKKRALALENLVRGSPERQSLQWWEDLFDRVAASGFLTGGGSRGWKADYDWVMRPDNLEKILAGNYDDNSRTRPRVREETLEEYARRMAKEVGL